MAVLTSSLNDYFIEDLEEVGTIEEFIFNEGTENEAIVKFVNDPATMRYALFIDGVLETSSLTNARYISAWYHGMLWGHFLDLREVGIIGGGDHEILSIFPGNTIKEDKINLEVHDPCIDEYLNFKYLQALKSVEILRLLEDDDQEEALRSLNNFINECVTFKNKLFNGFDTKKDLVLIDVSDELPTGNSAGFYSDMTVDNIVNSSHKDTVIVAYDPLNFFKNHKDLVFVKGSSYYCPYYKQEITVNALKVADHAVVA